MKMFFKMTVLKILQMSQETSTQVFSYAKEYHFILLKTKSNVFPSMVWIYTTTTRIMQYSIQWNPMSSWDQMLLYIFYSLQKTNCIPILQTSFGNCILINSRKTKYNLITNYNQVTEKNSQHFLSNMSKIEIKGSIIMSVWVYFWWIYQKSLPL